MARRRKRLLSERPSTSSVASGLSSRPNWLIGLCFVGLNLLLAGYFLDSIPSPNPTSRALPVLTVYEEGRYVIDTYEKETIDKSFINGHYYSDKAPLTTWIALPVYVSLKWLHVPEPRSQFRWLPVILLGDVLCGTLPFVLFAWLVFRRLIETVPAVDAVLLAMLPVYGSCVFAYSGVYMGHVLAGVLLCVSYRLSMKDRLPAVAGLALGLAVLTEFPVALAMPICVWIIVRRNRQDLIPFLLGGLPCLVALLLYNRAITGSYLKMPYDFEASAAFDAMRSSFGMRLPRPDAIWGLLFSEYRGLFYYVPALAILAVSYLLTKRSQALRELMTTPLGILSIAYVLLISSYFVWWGGWAYGPRHLIPVAMLLLYEALPVFARSGRFRGILYASSVAGLGMVWLAKVTTLNIMPEQYKDPVFELSWPAFEAGRFRHDALPSQAFGTDPLVAAWIWVALFVVSIIALRLLTRRSTLASV